MNGQHKIGKLESKIIVVEDNPIVHQPRKNVMRWSVVLGLAVLLALASFSLMGVDVAFVGSYIIATIPALLVALLVQKIFHRWEVSGVVGVLVVALMDWAGRLDPFIANIYQFLLALSHLAGFIVVLALAIIMGIVIRSLYERLAK